MEITKDCIAKLSEGDLGPNGNVVVQIIKVTEMKMPAGGKLYTFVLSDGETSTSATLAPEVRGIAPKLKENHLIRIKACELRPSPGGSTRLLLIKALDLAAESNERIGAPKKLLSPRGSQQTLKAPPLPVGPPDGCEYIRMANLGPNSAGWFVKVRVISKTQMARWSNEKGSGQMFSAVIKDGHLTEMTISARNRDAAHWFPRVELNKDYYISGAAVREANKKLPYLHNTHHQFEMILTPKTSLRLVKSSEDEADEAATAREAKAEEEFFKDKMALPEAGDGSKAAPQRKTTNRKLSEAPPKATIGASEAQKEESGDQKAAEEEEVAGDEKPNEPVQYSALPSDPGAGEP